ncbi:hypothetical protein, partial [Ruegeria sp.]|uniref:hypothetical protein n=1 Tax=Ruegeria sp. TaxID=1879320 RepID=UPI003AFF7DA1
ARTRPAKRHTAPFARGAARPAQRACAAAASAGGQDRALARIVLVSAHVAGLEADALRGGFKDREVAQARQMAMCLCAALTQATYGASVRPLAGAIIRR